MEETIHKELEAAECKRNPHRHGIDDEETNELTYRFTHELFQYAKERETYIGTGFLPCTVMWKAYGWAGEHINATPDGRSAGDALADSLGSIFGKDTEGVTALIKSVTAMDLKEVLGTPVVNISIQPNFDKKVLKSLIQSYMQLGGMQIQISCVDKEMIRKAYEDPDSYPNLIVRVGGFCEYFCNLDDTLRRKVLERTFYEK